MVRKCGRLLPRERVALNLFPANCTGEKHFCNRHVAPDSILGQFVSNQEKAKLIGIARSDSVHGFAAVAVHSAVKTGVLSK